MWDLPERFWNKVQITPGCWIWTGAKINGYGQIGVQGKTKRAHRLSYESMIGAIPSGMEIDHICHVRACVNPDHLQATTRKQNQENLAGATRRSKSGVRGVCWVERGKTWRATARHNGKLYQGGNFASLAEAAAAVVALRNRLYSNNLEDRMDRRSGDPSGMTDEPAQPEAVQS